MTTYAIKRYSGISPNQGGVIAALVTILIWASWLISMKIGVGSQLSTIDLAVLRYGFTGLVLFPVFIKALPRIRKTPKRYLSGIVFGAGLPFFYLSSLGMHYAPVADAGLLITGTFPLFVSFAAVAFYREKLTQQRAWGLVLILVGVVAILYLTALNTGLNAGVDHWKGDIIFLCASASWALFTVSLKLSGLRPWDAAAWLCVSSAGILLAGLLSGIWEITIMTAPFEQTLYQIFVQVLCVGLITGFSYGFAVRQLGAEKTSAIGALTPVLAVLAGLYLLGEPVQLAAWLGLGFITGGVLLASGVRLRKHSLY
ncbi:DMT family transporter [Neptunomonas sp.]|uniref:DMT family transporter n=1 Tax=Neptunomonas sp. TaxID=1971898 RepID=UPI0035688B90